MPIEVLRYRTFLSMVRVPRAMILLLLSLFSGCREPEGRWVKEQREYSIVVTEPTLMGSDRWLDIGAIYGSIFAIKEDRTLWGWGREIVEAFGNLQEITYPTLISSTPFWTGVGGGSSLGFGGARFCAHREDTGWWCWGRLRAMPLGLVGEKLSRCPQEAICEDWVPALPEALAREFREKGAVPDWVTLDTDGRTFCGINSLGVLYCWGENGAREAGTGESAVLSYPTAVTLEQRYLGDTLVTEPVQLSWKKASVGLKIEYGSSCGIQEDGSLWCWGYNFRGMVGIGERKLNEVVPYPTLVSSDVPWKDVSTGWITTCGVKVDGTLWCWGAYTYDVNRGDTLWTQRIISSVPVQIGEEKDWEDVEAKGELHVCALKKDHTLWCWGWRSRVVPGYSSPFPVRIGKDQDWHKVSTTLNQACALKLDRTLWCWGAVPEVEEVMVWEWDQR